MRLALRNINIARVPSRRFSGKSDYLHTQQRTQDCLQLTQNSHAVRRLSAKSLGRGVTLGRPTRRSSFLGHLRKPFFCIADDNLRNLRNDIQNDIQQLTNSTREMQTLTLLLRDLRKKSVVSIVQNVPVVASLLAVQGLIELKVQ